MVELKAHVALLTYRVIGFCLYPVIPFYLFFVLFVEKKSGVAKRAFR